MDTNYYQYTYIYIIILPKILTRIVFTDLSAFNNSNAFCTCSSDAPPPTSKKLAGSPPFNYVLYIYYIYTFLTIYMLIHYIQLYDILLYMSILHYKSYILYNYIDNIYMYVIQTKFHLCIYICNYLNSIHHEYDL